MRTLVSLFFAATISLVSFSLFAQPPQGGGGGKGGGKAPPKNLKVLPADTPNLGGLMRVYMASVGAMDCNFCHDPAQGAGKDSDANPRKATARLMISMVKEINAKFPDGKEHVTCYTCHRGQNMPATVAP